MCFLVGTLPNGLPFRHELAAGRTTVGRFAQSTIRLEEESISPLHAELIRLDSGRYLVRDLHSQFGIAVDGQEIFEDEVTAPCRLTFGRLTCDLLPDGAGPEEPSRRAAPSFQILLPRPVRQRTGAASSRPVARAVAPKAPPGLTAPLPRSCSASAAAFSPPQRYPASRPWAKPARLVAMISSVVLFGAAALLYMGSSRPPEAARRVDSAPSSSARPTPGLVAAGTPREAMATGDVQAQEKAILTHASESLPPAAMALAQLEIAAIPATLEAATSTSETEFAAAAESDAAPAGSDEPAVPESAPASPATTPEATLPSLVASIPGPSQAAAGEIAALPFTPTEGAVETAVPEAVPPMEPPTAVEQPTTLAAEVAFTPDSESASEAAPAPADAWGFAADASSDTNWDISASAPLPSLDWNLGARQMADAGLLANELSLKVTPWQFSAGSSHGEVNSEEVASLSRPAPATRSAPPAPTHSTPATQHLNVLILGDSLALCGFGKQLDRRFREVPNVRVTNTYMACGTLPLSWLKEAPYTNLKTFCGFWSIESTGGKKPLSLQETYGMGRGKPKAHLVPKLEDLLARQRPDVLVLQTGTNLFGLFRDGKTVQPARHGPMIRNQIQPFLAKILKAPHPPRAIYWVAPPVSGRVSMEVQEYVLQQVRAEVGAMATVIDSRKLVSYPYKHPEPDNEHFTGKDMDDWADGVFDLVQRELTAQPLPLSLALPPSLLEKGTASKRPAAKTAEALGEDVIVLKAKLINKSKPISLKLLKPYNESMVSFIYEVQSVDKGEYTDRQIMVMHPAHIAEKSQAALLEKQQIGRTYRLQVRDLEGSAWNAIKCKDDFGLNDLIPYIQIEDEARFPTNDQ